MQLFIVACIHNDIYVRHVSMYCTGSPAECPLLRAALYELMFFKTMYLCGQIIITLIYVCIA